jgi:hypothetical protein
MAPRSETAQHVTQLIHENRQETKEPGSVSGSNNHGSVCLTRCRLVAYPGDSKASPALGKATRGSFRHAI